MSDTDFEMPDAHRSLMRDNRVYSSPPLWRVSVSPNEAVIGPRSQWNMAFAHVVLFVLLGAGLYAARWFGFSDDVVSFCTLAAWFCWFMAVAFLAGIFIFEKFRSRKPWLVCNPLQRTVSCPRLNKVFTIDQIRALQLITGRVTRPNPEGRSVMNAAQLNLVVEEDGQLNRYPLIGDYGAGPLSRYAELLSQYCEIHLVRDKVSEVAEWDEA